MELAFRTSRKARRFIAQIATQMVEHFPISRAEAVERINRAWRHLDYVGDSDLIFHETPEYWAKTIYLGKDSQWWLDPGD